MALSLRVNFFFGPSTPFWSAASLAPSPQTFSLFRENAWRWSLAYYSAGLAFSSNADVVIPSALVPAAICRPDVDLEQFLQLSLILLTRHILSVTALTDGSRNTSDLHESLLLDASSSHINYDIRRQFDSSSYPPLSLLTCVSHPALGTKYTSARTHPHIHRYSNCLF